MNFRVKKSWKKVVATLPKFREILWGFGMHAFEAVLLIILIEIFFGVFLYYKDSVLIENRLSEISESSFHLDNDSYNKILSEWQVREKELQEFMQKDYTSPF
jgi:hypothetical protein